MKSLTLHPRPNASVAALTVGLALVAAWPLALSSFGRHDVYAYLGPFGLIVIAAMLLARRALHDARVRRPRARDVAVGVGVGVTMTVLTYVAYAACTRLIPALATRVAGLYVAAATQPLAGALVWTSVVIVAEELLWRDQLLLLLGRRVGARAAFAVSLGSYTLAQAASGSFVVALAALICGAIWTTERLATRSITAPLLSHLIWTMTVLHLFPVTRV